MRALIAALVLAGCTCPEPDAFVHQSFEHCADPTCGWQAGDGVELARVETLHPAEHGLAITGLGDARVAVSAQLYPYDSRALWLEATSTCGGEARADLVALPAGGYRLVLWLPFDDPPDGPAHQALHAPLSAPPVSGDLRIDELVVVNRRERCVVDEIRLLAEAYCY